MVTERIAVVDDDGAARLSLARLLELEEYVVQQFDSPVSLLNSSDLAELSCIVTDLRMPRLTGLDMQKAMEERGLKVPIVFVSAFGSIPVTVEAMRGGAVDFLEKPADPEALLAAVRRAVGLRAETRARNEILENALERVSRLTPRERDVFEGVARGLTNKGVAEQLGIAVKTVKIHRGRVMSKMEAESVADLVRDQELLASHKSPDRSRQSMKIDREIQ